MLSLLLGAHPAEIPVRTLVAVAEEHGVSGATLRVALSRMVGAGDLVTQDASYRLSDRLLVRQERQDRELDPTTRPWDGAWHQVVVTTGGREAGRRQELRRELLDARLAELREGVWLRPDNLTRPGWSAATRADTTTLLCHPEEDPSGLAARLWPLDAWQAQATRLLRALREASEPATRITVAAAAVRHLRTDPLLPDEVLPTDWAGPALRAAYADYRAELAGLLGSSAGRS